MTAAKNINDDLSKELQVKPLEGDEIAIFKLIRAGQIDPMTGLPGAPASHTLAGVDIIVDPKTKRSVRIFNIKEHIPIEREGLPTIYNVKHEAVTFGTKPIVCNKDTNDLYFYLMRTNANRDNEFRSVKYPPVFYRVDVDRDAAISVDTTEYKRLALNIVADCNEKELFTLAIELKDFGVSIDMNQKRDIFRRSMNSIAESQSEKVILSSTDNRSKTRIYIDRAIEKKEIAFNPDTSSWIWLETPQGGKVKKHITKIEKGNDPKRGLIDFLCGDKGSDHRTELVVRVSKEETYKAPEEKAVAPAVDLVKNYVKAQKERVAAIAPLEGL